MNASLNYGNMTKIHAEINANPGKYGCKIRFSTLSEYADHIHSLGIKFPVHRWPMDFEYGWPQVISVPHDGPPPPPGVPSTPNSSSVQYRKSAVAAAGAGQCAQYRHGGYDVTVH